MLPPYMWLLYWVLILFPTFIIAQRYIINKYISDCPHSKERGRRIVVARKFFHLVSVIMFGPPTYMAPEMMGLSYAVAVALLVLVERLRYLVLYPSLTNTSFCANEDGPCNDIAICLENKKLDSTYTTPMLPLEPCPPEISCSSLLNVNIFFSAFFDEKDEASSDGGFTVTHIALIIGCGFPLWINNIIVYDTHDYFRLMPFAGIVVLGIGDAAGAVYGVRWGKTRWPGGSNRTIEGSAAVFFSMIGISAVLRWIDCWLQGGGLFICGLSTSLPSTLLLEALVVWLPLTLLEAATNQIDNLCLPLMAVVLLSLF